MDILRNLICVIGMLFAINQGSYAQNKTARLKIGDPAPAINARWVKGGPIDRFDSKKLYVVEFWATWCNPCILAMPHLSDLATKYKDKVEFIGVNIWDSGMENKPYESDYPAIEKFVSGMGDKMQYNVAMDNNSLHMSTNWMKAAGQMGIPATFLIKDGLIVWIGHPQKIDPIIEQVLAGSYDMEEHAKAFNSKFNESEEALAPFYELKNEVEAALKAKEFRTALSLLETKGPGINARLNSALVRLKFATLLSYDVEKAVAFAEEKVSETPTYLSVLAAEILERDSLPAAVYRLANQYLLKVVSGPSGDRPYYNELVATSYLKLNDLKNAISYQEKAVQLAELGVGEGKFEGDINEGILEKYKATLERYNSMK